jgi:competence protein ComEA
MKRLAMLCALWAMTFTTAVWADPPARAATSATASAQPSPDGVVNVNTASAEELVRVPGIGPARADAIVRLRERVNHFRHVEDLVRVRGIGRATLRAMRPYLTLDGATTLAERPGRRRPTAEE